jgi:hypothetical protein
MVTWVMLSGTVKSSAGWDQNDMNFLVIINVFCKTFHNSLYYNLSFMYFVLIHSHRSQLSFKENVGLNSLLLIFVETSMS